MGSFLIAHMKVRYSPNHYLLLITVIRNASSVSEWGESRTIYNVYRGHWREALSREILWQ